MNIHMYKECLCERSEKNHDIFSNIDVISFAVRNMLSSWIQCKQNWKFIIYSFEIWILKFLSKISSVGNLMNSALLPRIKPFYGVIILSVMMKEKYRIFSPLLFNTNCNNEILNKLFFPIKLAVRFKT